MPYRDYSLQCGLIVHTLDPAYGRLQMLDDEQPSTRSRLRLKITRCLANSRVALNVIHQLGIQSASQVVDSVVHEIGVKTLELILSLSAEQVAGPRTPGKASGEIRHYGSQQGRVQLADRKVRVKRPRLRHKTEGEVPIRK